MTQSQKRMNAQAGWDTEEDWKLQQIPTSFSVVGPQRETQERRYKQVVLQSSVIFSYTEGETLLQSVKGYNTAMVERASW